MLKDTMLFAISQCFEVIKIYLLLHYIGNCRDRETKIKYVIVAGVIITTVMSYVLIGDNIISYSIMVAVTVCALFVNKWYKNVIWSLWAALVIAFIDYFWVFFLQFITSLIGVEEKNMHEIYGTFCTIFTIVIMAVVYVHVNRDGYMLPSIYYIIFSIVTLANELMLGVYVDGVKLYFEKVPASAMICLCICVVAFLMEMLAILILGSMNNMYRERERLQEEIIRNQKQYYKDLELRDEDTRRFRHDIRDHIHVIKQLMNEKDYKQAYTYIDNVDEIIDSLKRVSVGNSAVDAVVSQYISLAESQGIKMRVLGGFPEELCVRDYDLCTIVSNILRNAIEAAPDDINIQFRYDEDYIYIRETNPCDDTLTIINSIPNTIKDDKKNHGYGIRNIKRVVDKYEGVLSIFAEQGKFTVYAILKNKEV